MEMESVLMFQNCITYKKRDKDGNKTDVDGFILNMLELSKDEKGDLSLNSVQFFPAKFSRLDLKPFDLVKCKIDVQINRKPALLDLLDKVQTPNKMTIMLP
jgi:hypothetical protein